MTDERSRELERRAAAGDAEALMRILADRVRGGTIPEEDLLLLAYAQDPLADDQVGTHGLNVPRDLHRWALGLHDWGVGVCRLAALAAARLVAGKVKEETLAARVEQTRAALDQVSNEALATVDPSLQPEAKSALALLEERWPVLLAATRAAEELFAAQPGEVLAARSLLWAARAVWRPSGVQHDAANALRDAQEALDPEAGEAAGAQVREAVLNALRNEVFLRSLPD